MLQAGLIDSLDSGQLVIALEPEAASLHCRTLPVDEFSQDYGDTTQPGGLQLNTGAKYMVIDAGGKFVCLNNPLTTPALPCLLVHLSHSALVAQVAR